MIQHKAKVMDGQKIKRTITRIAHEILERNKTMEDLVLVCIEEGGNDLGRWIQRSIRDIEGIEVPVLSVDTSPYRDDRDRLPRLPAPADAPLFGKVVVLIDDVLHTGRTVRAALDALNDLGRPRKVELAVLIDRGHRELPIRADFVGKNVPTSKRENVEVSIRSPLEESSVTITEEIGHD